MMQLLVFGPICNVNTQTTATSSSSSLLFVGSFNPFTPKWSQIPLSTPPPLLCYVCCARTLACLLYVRDAAQQQQQMLFLLIQSIKTAGHLLHTRRVHSFYCIRLKVI